MDELGVLARFAGSLASRGQRGVLVTVVRVAGSSFRREGARLVVAESGEVVGHVSGGCLEGDLAERAKQLFVTSAPLLVKYEPRDHDPIFGLGSGCSGRISIFIEPLTTRLVEELQRAAETRPFETIIATCVFGSDAKERGSRFVVGGQLQDAAGREAFVERIEPIPSLLICGAGPVAQPLASMAKTIGWRVVVADHRRAFASAAMFPTADEIVVGDPETLIDRIRPGARPVAVLLSHVWNLDVALLPTLLARDIPYVGLLGSRSRREKILRQLGGEMSQFPALHAPAGLALGAITPPEIALSILSEIQATLRGVTPKALRERSSTRSGTALVVLAAGGSSRFGSPKQVAEFHGRPLVRQVVESALATKAAAVFVVIGANGERVRETLRGLDVSFIENREWESGMASSLRAAVEAMDADYDSVLVTLGDQPLVTTADLDRMIDRHIATGRPIVASDYAEGGGVPALFDATMFDSLRKLEGDSGARDLIRSMPERTELVAIRTDDVDTPRDVVRQR